MSEIFCAGNTGPKLRSDCMVRLELKDSGGLVIVIDSKVKALYGESIRELALAVLEKSGIKHAWLQIEDSGALPFVLSARLERAVNMALGSEIEFLPEIIAGNTYSTKRERFRFSRLYLPGNTPSMMINAGIHKPGGIILDLEDSVAPGKKEEARILVRNALRQVNFYETERMVRINQVPMGLDDLKYVVPHPVNLVLVPKTEDPGQIVEVEKEVARLKEEHGIKKDIWLMPIIESALGVENAFLIAKSSPNIVAMAIGLEDLTADLGVRRTDEGAESLYARTRIVNACTAAGIQAIDSVFSDVADEDGLRANVARSRALGFQGMGCIHPRQIAVINEAYAPSEPEIQKAGEIVNAFMIAREQGLGVVSLGSKMIDLPVVKRAQRTINLAIELKLLNKDWRDKYAG